MAEFVQGLIGKNLTRVGVIGGLGFFGCQIALGVIHGKMDEIISSLGYLFLMLIPAGAAFRVKKGVDLLVSSEAEKRIANPAVPSTSSVPAIQREISRQLSEQPMPAKDGDAGG